MEESSVVNAAVTKVSFLGLQLTSQTDVCSPLNLYSNLNVDRALKDKYLAAFAGASICPCMFSCNKVTVRDCVLD